MEYFKDCMTEEQLKARYKELVIKLHPDRNPDNPNAKDEFQEMQQQYEERKAELNGDYTKARKGRERREREERERRERERKEQARRKVEQVVEQARLNRQKSHRELKAGDYIYAKGVEWDRSFDKFNMTASDVIFMAASKGVKDECVVLIETIFECSDKDFFNAYFHQFLSGDVWGGWEVLQTADGSRKGKRVAKVVMYRSEHYCIFGNPMGDQMVNEYYFRHDYDTMFSANLAIVRAQLEREARAKERAEAERRAKLLAEQTPLIEEWKDKLIMVSRGLNDAERKKVAVDNFKTVLKHKFPGVKFNVRLDKYGDACVKWEDGPLMGDVEKVIGLFDIFGKMISFSEKTPWVERFGGLTMGSMERNMSVLTKARILQDLGQVTEAFRECEMHDDVELSEFDWMMLHALVGVSVGDPDAKLCMSTLHADGRRTVTPAQAVRYVFNHTGYAKAKPAKKKQTA